MAEMAEIGDNSGDTYTFDIDMFPTGDSGSGFHTKNDPSDPYQRSNIINRKGAVDVKCTCVDTVHGSYDGSSYGTLLVLLFRFDPRKRARRVVSANISLMFSGMKVGASRPEVMAISMDGRYSMQETTQTEEVTKGGDVSLGVNAMQSVEAGAGYFWEKTTSADVTDSTTVVGSVDLIGFDYGPDNCASWSLMENATRKDGVPSSMRVGILLKRKTRDEFKCFVEIKAEADFKSGLEMVFGSRPKDDPVLFKPSMQPTNKLMKYELDNLGEFDLDLVSDVTCVTRKGGVIKEK